MSLDESLLKGGRSAYAMSLRLLRGVPALSAFLVLARATGQSSAEPETLQAVLTRAASYVETFEQRLSGIVAEETLVQDAYEAPRFNRAGIREVPHSGHRELKSDLLLIRPIGAAGWIPFRDVFEVDGKPVRDRTDRLARLFLTPSTSTSGQARKIATESSRYNIGTIERTVNVPVLPLMFLDASHQSRFTFKVADTDRDRLVIGESVVTLDLPASPRFTVSTEMWVVEYREVGRPTVILGQQGKLVPSRGRYWIEPASGRVLMSELIAENEEVRGKIDVSYQSEPLVGLLVPIEMRASYDRRLSGATIEERATYRNFRQFQVTVDEKLAPIEDKLKK
jgi:hypothetical protein